LSSLIIIIVIIVVVVVVVVFVILSRDFSTPLRGVNTFAYTPHHQFDLVTPRGVKSLTDAQNMELLHEIWSFGSQENHLICCHQMSDFKGKMHQIQFRLEGRGGDPPRVG